MMQSQNFVLKFITGLQKGVVSKLLEMETDWFDMMEIMLSRLEDEPTNQERFEDISARDLDQGGVGGEFVSQGAFQSKKHAAAAT